MLWNAREEAQFEFIKRWKPNDKTPNATKNFWSTKTTIKLQISISVFFLAIKRKRRHPHPEKLIEQKLTHPWIWHRTIPVYSAATNSPSSPAAPSTLSATSLSSSSITFPIEFDNIIQRHVDFIHFRCHFSSRKPVPRVEWSDAKRNYRMTEPRWHVSLYRGQYLFCGTRDSSNLVPRVLSLPSPWERGWDSRPFRITFSKSTVNFKPGLAVSRLPQWQK